MKKGCIIFCLFALLSSISSCDSRTDLVEDTRSQDYIIESLATSESFVDYIRTDDKMLEFIDNYHIMSDVKGEDSSFVDDASYQSLKEELFIHMDKIVHDVPQLKDLNDEDLYSTITQAKIVARERGNIYPTPINPIKIR